MMPTAKLDLRHFSSPLQDEKLVHLSCSMLWPSCRGHRFPTASHVFLYKSK